MSGRLLSRRPIEKVAVRAGCEAKLAGVRKRQFEHLHFRVEPVQRPRMPDERDVRLVAFERPAGDEERRGHPQAFVDLDDPAARRQTGRRFRIVGGDVHSPEF